MVGIAIGQIPETSVATAVDNEEDTDAKLTLGDVLLGVGILLTTELLTGIDDLLIAIAVEALPREEVEAVLKAGLAAVGIPNTPMLDAGVLITTGVAVLVLGRTGLKLLALFKIGVSLGLTERIGEAVDSCQLGLTSFKFVISSFLSLLLLLFKFGPFCNLISSNELLLVTGGVLLVFKKSCFAIELVVAWEGNGP